MKKIISRLLFWFGAVFLMELVFHLAVWGNLTERFIWAVPFSLFLALLFTVLSGAWPWKLANHITAFTLLSALGFLYSVQTVYQYIFDSLLSLSYVGQGAEAISNYFGVMMNAILHCLPLILLYFLPILALALLNKFRVTDADRAPVLWELGITALAALILLLGIPARGDAGVRSQLFYDLSSTIDSQAEVFGLVPGEALELVRLISDDTGMVTDTLDLTPSSGKDKDNHGDTSWEGKRNIMEGMDLDALLEAADTDQRRELTEYFKSLSGTSKNKYTGIFEGFNVIEICAESFWYYLPDPELTPTLYKLTHEGFVFDNFYCSFAQTTSNGEYSLCMGLLPDFNRMSFNIATGNYLPFTLGNRMERLGVAPKAYHDYTIYLYGRATSHPNMGYTIKGIENGLTMSREYVYSDDEMFRQTVEEYINEDRFMVHYMTYSAHHPYDFSLNGCAAVNHDAVADLDAPEAVKAYIAANLELDRGLAYLLQRLEEKGILDKTLIILTGDHFPYALSEEDQEFMAGDAVETIPFWMYKNNFVCWSGAIQEPIHVSGYCCTQDILPTVLNLLGIEYDSRLLTGRDVLSDCIHVAVLQTGCFLTEDLLYNVWTGEVTYLTPKEELPEGYAEQLVKAVSNQFNVAAAILRSDYYGFAFETLGFEEMNRHQISGATFYDTEGKFYQESVNQLAAKGVVTGDGYVFRGEETVTRGEFAKTVCNLMNFEIPETEEIPIPGLSRDDPAYNYVRALWNAGLLPSDVPFDTAGALTAQEAMDFAGKLSVHFDLDSQTLRSIMSEALRLTEESGTASDPVTRGAAAYFIWNAYVLLNP